jgi:hypothetical protein
MKVPVVLFVWALAAHAIILRGTLLMNENDETQSYVTIDSASGNVTIVKG